MTRLLPMLLLTACPSDPNKPDTGDEPPSTVSCAPDDHDTLSLQIGTGQGSQFTPLEEGASVTLDVAGSEHDLRHSSEVAGFHKVVRRGRDALGYSWCGL